MVLNQLHFTLLRTQLITAAMMLGKASTALTPDLPSSDANAFSLCLGHSFTSFTFSGGGLLCPAAPQPLGSNTVTKTLIAIRHEYGSDCNVLLPKQHPYSRITVFIQYFGDRLFEAHNLAVYSALQKVDAFLSDFQVVVKLGSHVPDFFWSAIVVFWIV